MRLGFVWAATFGTILGITAVEYQALCLVAATAGFLIVIWRWRPAVVMVVFCLLGWWRMDSWLSGSIAEWSRRFDQSLMVTGTVVAVHARGAVLADLKPRLPGMLELRGAVVPAGAMVTVSCRPYPASLDFRRAVARRTIAACDQPRVQNILRKHWSPRAWLAGWRFMVTQKLTAALRTDAGALAVGLVFGDDDLFPADLREAFRRTGTTHVVALSGYNVSLILTVTMETLAQWLGRRRSTWCSLGLLLSFIVMTGAAASVVRAGAMALAVQAAQFIGRPVSPWRPLGYAVMVMLFQNPGLLLHDVGFQLSALSTIGLMTLSRPIGQALNWLPNAWSLRENTATTMAATVATLPLTITVFGRLSLVSVGANALVLPLMPVAMALSMLLVVAVQVGKWLEALVRPATEVLLTSITTMLEWAAQLSWAAQTVPTAVGIILSLVIVLTMVRYVYEEFYPVR